MLRFGVVVLSVLAACARPLSGAVVSVDVDTPRAHAPVEVTLTSTSCSKVTATLNGIAGQRDQGSACRLTFPREAAIDAAHAPNHLELISGDEHAFVDVVDLARPHAFAPVGVPTSGHAFYLQHLGGLTVRDPIVWWNGVPGSAVVHGAALELKVPDTGAQTLDVHWLEPITFSRCEGVASCVARVERSQRVLGPAEPAPPKPGDPNAPPWQTIALLVGVALLAGLIDAIAGGGGLLTVPALMATGLPPHLVFGTNKGSAVFGALASLVRFWRAGLVRRGVVLRLLFLLGLVGSFIGAGIQLVVDASVLKPVALVLLVAAGVVVAFVKPPVHEGVAPAPSKLVAGSLALVIGAYDGFFGPGTGTFLIIGFVGLLRFTLKESSANAKVVNFASNLAAVALFATRGTILWKLALPMAAGQLIGGTLGAHLAVKGGDTVIRKVVLAVVVALVSKLGYDLLARS